MKFYFQKERGPFSAQPKMNSYALYLPDCPSLIRLASLIILSKVLDLPRSRQMRFSRWVFNIAGAYGVITVAPLYFMEQTINRQDPPPITHPMFFYGFVGVTLAWQLLFFAIAYQPVRLRPVIPFAVLEKLSFGIGAMVLYRRGRLGL